MALDILTFDAETSITQCKICYCNNKKPSLDWYPLWGYGKGRVVEFDHYAADEGHYGRFRTTGILYLGTQPHIHAGHLAPVDLSGERVYAFGGVKLFYSAVDVASDETVEVSVNGAKCFEVDESATPQLALQQMVIAFNLTQHKIADTVTDAAGGVLLPVLGRTVAEYAVTVPVGERLQHQIVPTFDLGGLTCDERRARVRSHKQSLCEFQWFGKDKVIKSFTKPETKELIMA